MSSPPVLEIRKLVSCQLHFRSPRLLEQDRNRAYVGGGSIISNTQTAVSTPEWLNLNGIWDFNIDDHNIGLAQRWFLTKETFPHRILAPFSFESPKSGIDDPSFHLCVVSPRVHRTAQVVGKDQVLPRARRQRSR